MSTICPFCKNAVNEGATVCASCHAFVSTPFRINGSVGRNFIFLGGMWLLSGPIMLLYSISDLNIVWLVLSLPITGLGYFLIRALYRRGNRQLWYRR